MNFNYMSEDLSEIVSSFNYYITSCPCCKVLIISKNDIVLVKGMLIALEKNKLFDRFMETSTGKTILLNIMVYDKMINISSVKQEVMK